MLCFICKGNYIIPHRFLNHKCNYRQCKILPSNHLIQLRKSLVKCQQKQLSFQHQKDHIASSQSLGEVAMLQQSIAVQTEHLKQQGYFQADQSKEILNSATFDNQLMGYDKIKQECNSTKSLISSPFMIYNQSNPSNSDILSVLSSSKRKQIKTKLKLQEQPVQNISQDRNSLIKRQQILLETASKTFQVEDLEEQILSTRKEQQKHFIPTHFTAAQILQILQNYDKKQIMEQMDWNNVKKLVNELKKTREYMEVYKQCNSIGGDIRLLAIRFKGKKIHLQPFTKGKPRISKVKKSAEQIQIMKSKNSIWKFLLKW